MYRSLSPKGPLPKNNNNNQPWALEPAKRALELAGKPRATWKDQLGAQGEGVTEREGQTDRTKRFQYVVVPYVIVPYGAAAQKQQQPWKRQ